MNNAFFKAIDSPHKAYWLGFLYADGGMDRRGSGLILELSDKDEDQLDRFMNALGQDSSQKRYRELPNSRRSVMTFVYDRNLA